MSLKEWIKESNNIVFFGGAGVSTESNIPDFRSDNGLYKKQYPYPAEIMLSHSFYESNPKEFFEFYFNQMIYKDAKPNKAHLALAQLEKQGKLKAVITQNIDGLHQAAGSKTVYELHGSVLRNTCTGCHEKYTLDQMLEFHDENGIPRCPKCNHIISGYIIIRCNKNTGKCTLVQNTRSQSSYCICSNESRQVVPAFITRASKYKSFSAR